jgi:heme oxygenase (biliverdin-IX-beta and delta-forming)
VKARAYLKDRTQAAHDRVDALFSRLDLSRPDDYRSFLEAQAEAHLAVEAGLDAAGAEKVLPDWPQRRRGEALRGDLRDLGGGLGMVTPVVFAGDAEILGGIYVLEGSRLGGSVLKKLLPQGAPRRFLDGDQEPGSWRKLLEKLEEALYDSARLDAATNAALRVFARFETAARGAEDEII